MLTREAMREIVSDISYKPGFTIEVQEFAFGGGSYLQVRLSERTGTQKGRKWYLSLHMTISEVVQTALMAILAFEEHEARETFMYKGRKVFNPHFNVELLAGASRSKDWLDLREGGEDKG